MSKRRTAAIFGSALLFGLIYMIPALPEGLRAEGVPTQATWSAFLKIGDDHAKAGAVEPALDAYQDALRFAGSDLERAVSRLRLGQGLLALGEVERAATELELAHNLAGPLQGTPAVPYVEILFALEEAYLSTDRPRQAERIRAERLALEAMAKEAMPAAPAEDA